MSCRQKKKSQTQKNFCYPPTKITLPENKDKIIRQNQIFEATIWITDKFTQLSHTELQVYNEK